MLPAGECLADGMDTRAGMVLAQHPERTDADDMAAELLSLLFSVIAGVRKTSEAHPDLSLRTALVAGSSRAIIQG